LHGGAQFLLRPRIRGLFRQFELRAGGFNLLGLRNGSRGGASIASA
jgi:hypothetical protein